VLECLSEWGVAKVRGSCWWWSRAGVGWLAVGGTADSSCSERGGGLLRVGEREEGGVWSFQVSFYSVQISLLEDKYLANT